MSRGPVQPIRVIRPTFHRPETAVPLWWRRAGGRDLGLRLLQSSERQTGDENREAEHSRLAELAIREQHRCAAEE